MAISFNTAGSSNSGAQQTTLTLTIPAGVQAGDVMLLCVNAFTPSFTLTPTIASTGTAFTQIGSTQFSNNNSGFVVSGSVWYAVASASDAGKVITASGGNCFWALTVAAYSGVSNVTPIDVNGGTAVANNTTASVVCPSETTGRSGDWAVYLCPWGMNGLTVAPALSGQTQRANQNGSGVGTAVWDSNGSVGAAGASIGGGTITGTASTYWWTAFTVGLAPASSAPPSGSVMPPVIPPHPHFTRLLLEEAWQRADWQAQGVADLTVAFASTSGGVDTYNVTSPYNGGVNQPMRVLKPTAPSGNYPHSFLLILPVEAAEGTVFGDPIAVAQTLTANNTYNLTCIEPGFTADPWLANNPVDPAVQQETYLLKLLTWIKANLATAGTERVYLIGFSKSGPACQFLQFRHPDLFAAVASWDFPAMMTDYDGTDPTFGGTVGGNSATVYGTSANFQTNYQLSAPSLANWAAPGRFGVNRIWIGGFASFGADVPAYDALLTAAGIPHTYTWSVSETHAWHTDWVAAALASIIPGSYAQATTTLPQQIPQPMLTRLLDIAAWRIPGASPPAVTSAAANAQLATGTGTALGPVPAVGVNAVLATGTGTAQGPAAAVAVNAGLATGTGTAQSPVAAIAVNAVLASAAGTAQNATASTSASGTANAVLATGTGAAQSPVAATGVNAAAATGAGAALNATASTSSSGTANAVLATAAGTAQNPVPAIAVIAAAATGAGAAQGIGRAATAGLASGTGTAQAPTAVLAAQAQAQAAHALAAALNASGAGVEPFTVGTLTASDAPLAVLTASTQTTGGPS